MKKLLQFITTGYNTKCLMTAALTGWFLFTSFGVRPGDNPVPAKAQRSSANVQRSSAKVSILQQNGSFRLLRNGQPYFIKGAVGKDYLEKLQLYGGNSIRADSKPGTLDEAYRLGLSVLVNLPVKAERDGMDYDNAASVQQQHDQIMDIVRKAKDHPAVLMWALGNELDEGAGKDSYNPAVWDAVNALAVDIHRLDPDHPVMTVVGSVGKGAVIHELNKRCAALDLLGVNEYGGLKKIPGWLRDQGWTKPYVVTEWGPTGFWQVPNTPWHAPIEETSSVKADKYLERYEQVIAKDTAKCLGSYVFLWRQHQERTHTWFGMFDADGQETEAVDVMRYEWTGKWPSDRAPRLDSVKIEGHTAYQKIYCRPGGTYSGQVWVREPEEQPVRYNWEILKEGVHFPYGGNGEERPPAVPGLIPETDKSLIHFKAPREEGAYRLFVYAYDQHGHWATANIPFYISADPGGSLADPAVSSAGPAVSSAGQEDASPGQESASPGQEQVSLSIDTGRTYQTIEGFGAFNTISQWKGTAPSRKYDLIADDLGLSILRFELPPTFQPRKDSDYNLKGTVFGGPDLQQNFEDVRQLKKRGVTKFIATIWSPPAWMKTLNEDGKGPTTSRGGRLREDKLEDFAGYCAAYCRTFKKETGIDLFAIGLQNEPEFAEPYNSCKYNPAQMREALRFVGRRFRKEGITTRIYVPEALPAQRHLPDFFDAINKDEETRKYADVFAIHNYDADGMNVGGAGSREWENYAAAAASVRPVKEVWMTETSGHANSWPGAMLLAANIYNALEYGNLSAWLWWSLADNKSSAVYGLIIDGVPSGRYYTSKHYYHFIRPGAVRVDAKTGQADVLSLAFTHSGKDKLVVILINKGNVEKLVDLPQVEGHSRIHAYLSTDTLQCQLQDQVTGNKVRLPAQSIMTLTWE